MLRFAAMRRPTRAPAAIVAAVLLALSTPASAHHRVGPCDVHRRDGETARSHSTRLIRCAVAEWEVAEAESRLNPRAESEDGAYVGLFQHSAAAWPDRFAEWTEPEWQLDERPTSGRTNAIVTIRMVNANGWGSWSGIGDC
jgi:hypothetical protein